MEGHFARHIRHVHHLYADRRAASATALPEPPSDVEPVRRATAQGPAPHALPIWRVDRDCGQGLLLSFANTAEESARDADRRLKQAIES
jgi:DNA-binding transcriptional MocR family regulator